MQKIYWWLYIVRLSLRWIFALNIGDEVWLDGERWMLVQGVCAPSWHLMRGDERKEFVHESQFKKVRSLKNYWCSFRSGYLFYMMNWYGIWLTSGIEPWMRGCNIWKRSQGIQ